MIIIKTISNKFLCWMNKYPLLKDIINILSFIIISSFLFIGILSILTYCHIIEHPLLFINFLLFITICLCYSFATALGITLFVIIAMFIYKNYLRK